MQSKKTTLERPTGVTERLCRTIAEIGLDSIPEEAVNAAKRVILDGIAVAIAGVHEEGPRIAADHIRSLGGGGGSVVLGMGFRANPVSAALVNGISIHILDFEPMWMPPTHAVSPSLPSVLAAAEMKRRTAARSSPPSSRPARYKDASTSRENSLRRRFSFTIRRATWA